MVSLQVIIFWVHLILHVAHHIWPVHLEFELLLLHRRYIKILLHSNIPVVSISLHGGADRTLATSLHRSVRLGQPVDEVGILDECRVVRRGHIDCRIGVLAGSLLDFLNIIILILTVVVRFAVAVRFQIHRLNFGLQFLLLGF